MRTLDSKLVLLSRMTQWKSPKTRCTWCQASCTSLWSADTSPNCYCGRMARIVNAAYQTRALCGPILAREHQISSTPHAFELQKLSLKMSCSIPVSLSSNSNRPRVLTCRSQFCVEYESGRCSGLRPRNGEFRVGAIHGACGAMDPRYGELHSL